MHWYGGSIAEAVTLSKQKNAIFVVFVEGKWLIPHRNAYLGFTPHTFGVKHKFSGEKSAQYYVIFSKRRLLICTQTDWIWPTKPYNLIIHYVRKDFLAGFDNYHWCIYLYIVFYCMIQDTENSPFDFSLTCLLLNLMLLHYKNLIRLK